MIRERSGDGLVPVLSIRHIVVQEVATISESSRDLLAGIVEDVTDHWRVKLTGAERE